MKPNESTPSPSSTPSGKEAEKKILGETKAVADSVNSPPQNTHVLKSWPEYFERILDGSKPFEHREERFRKCPFAVGDILRLQEWEPIRNDPACEVHHYHMGDGHCTCYWIGEYTGREIDVRVTYLMRGERFGLREGYVCMAIAPSVGVGVSSTGVSVPAKPDVSEGKELLPCPFCGSGEANLLLPTCRPETPYNAADRLYPVVRCSRCYAEAIGKNEDYKGGSALLAWNTRPAPSGITPEKKEERIRELEKVLASTPCDDPKRKCLVGNQGGVWPSYSCDRHFLLLDQTLEQTKEVGIKEASSDSAISPTHIALGLEIVDAGHKYRLPSFDGEWEQVLTFMKREGDGYPGNVGSYPGTNLQSVLRACLNRVVYLQGQIPHENNVAIICHLSHSLRELEQRAAERHGFNPNAITLHMASYGAMCVVCGHVLCGHSVGHALLQGAPPVTKLLNDSSVGRANVASDVSSIPETDSPSGSVSEAKGREA